MIAFSSSLLFSLGVIAAVSPAAAPNHSEFLPVRGGFEQNLPGTDTTVRFAPAAVTITQPGAETLRMRATAWGRRSHPVALRPSEASAWVCADGCTTIAQSSAGIVHWWRSLDAGLEQGFTIDVRPRGSGSVFVELATYGGVASLQSPYDARLSTQGGRHLRYDTLRAWDARGVDLPIAFEPTEEGLRIIVDDTRAIYPIVIDPLLTQEPVWEVAGAGPGSARTNANGDAYDDLVVTNFVQGGESSVALHLGGPAGPAPLPSWTVPLADPAWVSFAGSVGDVDGDGIEDLLVAEPLAAETLTFQGRVRLFLGSSDGPSPDADWSALGPVIGNDGSGGLGGSIAEWTDLNGDGYDDIVALSATYLNVSSGTGRVFVFYGGPAGPSATADVELGAGLAETFEAISSIGDVTGDGYDDLVVRIGDNRGAALAVWYGGPAGFSPSADAMVRVPGGLFGEFGLPLFFCGGEASGINGPYVGDFDGNGREDLVVLTTETTGQLLGYPNDGSGVATRPDWVLDDITAPPPPDKGGGGGMAGGAGTFGCSGTAGDLDGDGYQELIFTRPSAIAGSVAHMFGVPGTPLGLAAAPADVIEFLDAQSVFANNVTFVGDLDGDGFGEVAIDAFAEGAQESTRLVFEGVAPVVCELDGDLDAVCDAQDNCPGVFNPAQRDFDEDGVGDLCESGGADGGNDEGGLGTSGADGSSSSGESSSGGADAIASTGPTSGGEGTGGGGTGAGAPLNAEIAETGCSCRSDRGPGTGAVGLGVLGLLGLFRRRQRALGCVAALAGSACSEPPRPLGLSDTADTAATLGEDATDAGAEAGTGTGTGTESTSGAPDLGGRCCASDGSAIVGCDNEQVITACAGGEVCDQASLACVDACAAAEAREDSVGCDYYAVALPTLDPGEGLCFAAVISNPGHSAAHLKVSYAGGDLDLQGHLVSVASALELGEPFDGKSDVDGARVRALDPSEGIAPGEVAAVLLAGGNCSGLGDGRVEGLSAAVPDAMVKQTGVADAFHLTTDVPVVAQQVMPFLGANSYVAGASLLQPTPTWGSNYTVLSPAEAFFAAEGLLTPTLNVVASRDDTTVTLLPTVALEGGGALASAVAGESTTVVLNAGEHLQVLQQAELTGTIIDADADVAVFVGHECVYLPANTPACDHLEQMLPSLNTLGSTYAAVAVDRNGEAGLWRVFGAVNDTELTWSTDVGGPANIARGEAVWIATTEKFVVQSQDADHPFYLFNYMTGAEDMLQNTPFDPLFPPTLIGDPDFVLAVAPDQYLRDYTFFADPTYANQLIFVRSRGAPSGDTPGGFSPVELDCGDGQWQQVTGWSPVGDGEYESVRLKLAPVTGVVGCSGRLAARSADPFGLHVWGLNAYASIGYPAGMGLQPLNQISVPAEG